MVANAVRRSRETSTAPAAEYGLITLTTCGIVLTRASSGAIAARTCGASTLPRELWKTIVSTSPLWALNSRAEQIHDPLGLGAGQAEVGGVLAPHARRDRGA